MPPNKREDTFSVIKSCGIQSGLSQGLILIQSSINGGSRFTTKSFCETERPIAFVYPVQADFDLPSYSANKEISINGTNGLVKFAELKEERVRISKLLVIKSKDDYAEFESLMMSAVNSGSR